MFRFSPSQLYTTFRSQHSSINTRSASYQLDNFTRRNIARYARQQAGVGQNLSDRYLRLEESLRGKEALSQELYSYRSSSIPAGQSIPLSKSSSRLVQVFHGFEIPEEPKPPADDGMFFLTHSSLSSVFADNFC